MATDAELLAAFREGERDAAVGWPDDENRYDDEERAQAWEAGWWEEAGPTFTVSPRVRRDRAGATLADVWPAELRRLTIR